MNRANQEALFQATNQGLLSIRQSEINYYQSLNVAFGTQAALIGGFTYGVFSQNQINYSNDYENVDVLADVYWICSAITIALSVHVILCTMLMQVLGPGLALNGPVGSMARATEGMRLEQKQIIAAFIGMMIMFSVSTVLSCWVVMSFEASIGCSISFAVAACYWYKYCERIYLRFYWEAEESGWNARTNSFDEMNEQEPTAHSTLGKGATGQGNKVKLGKDKKKRSLFSSLLRLRKKIPEQTTIVEEPEREFGSLGGRDDKDSSRDPAAATAAVTTGSAHPLRRTLTNSSYVPESASQHIVHPLKRTTTNSSYVSDFAGHGGMVASSTSWAAASATRGVVMEGYLTKRGGGGQKLIDFRNEPWERRYFTLTSTSCLFIYKTRHDYRNDPNTPIYTRPLRLYEYYIEVNNSDSAARDTIGQDSFSEVDSTADIAKHKALFAVNNITVPDDSDIKPFRFQMTLVLRENVETMGSSSVVEVSAQGVANPMRAQSMRAQRYRDHWVLRCDTEEELQQWVNVMRELCPSCFKNV